MGAVSTHEDGSSSVVLCVTSVQYIVNGRFETATKFGFVYLCKS